MVLNCIFFGDFMVFIDFKDVYFSVFIFQFYCKYLCFFWNFKCYEFICLFFGYSFVFRVFIKIFKFVIVYFRFFGFRVIIFIDDFIFIVSFYDECLQ